MRRHLQSPPEGASAQPGCCCGACKHRPEPPDKLPPARPTLFTSPAGVGLSHLTGAVRQMMKKITSVDQDNYPEMLGKTCIINAPGAFKMIWSGVQGMIEPRTRAKIEVGADATLRPMFSLGMIGCYLRPPTAMPAWS